MLTLDLINISKLIKITTDPLYIVLLKFEFFDTGEFTLRSLFDHSSIHRKGLNNFANITEMKLILYTHFIVERNCASGR
jgi:hypothetical protein